MAEVAYKIEKKRNGRYSVLKRGGGYINGEEKAKILLDKGLIKLTAPKPKEEAPAEAEEAAPAE